MTLGIQEPKLNDSLVEGANTGAHYQGTVVTETGLLTEVATRVDDGVDTPIPVVVVPPAAEVTVGTVVAATIDSLVTVGVTVSAQSRCQYGEEPQELQLLQGQLLSPLFSV